MIQMICVLIGGFFSGFLIGKGVATWQIQISHKDNAVQTQIKGIEPMNQSEMFYLMRPKIEYTEMCEELKYFLMYQYDIRPSLAEKTVEEMFKKGTEFISLEEQKGNNDRN
jgi:hypothetical protein